MKRKPTTNPQINGQPMSFVRLGSLFETHHGGQSIGHPLTRREVKRQSRRARLQRRANFRIAKRFAAITSAVLG